MNMIVVTTCTNRKRLRPEKTLQARSLKRGLLDDVARQWVGNIKVAPRRVEVTKLYCGRGFSEALKTSTSNQVPLFVISAGLGVISGDQCNPAYSLTLTNGSPDAIWEKIIEPIYPPEWWTALSNAQGRETPFASLVKEFPNQRVLVACSEIYALMIAKDIESLPNLDQDRIRIFGPRNPSRLPSTLRPLIMPYDERFDGPDGPLRGTRNDFPQRTLRHFVESLMPTKSNSNNPKQDALLIKDALEKWPWPARPVRQKMSDEKIIEMVLKLWEQARGGSGRMLRLLRDEQLVACGQRRFATLFKQAKKRYSL
jgi:hypothetical protein